MACIALPCLLIAGLIFRDCVKNVKRDIEKALNELHEGGEAGDETVPDPVAEKGATDDVESVSKPTAEAEGNAKDKEIKTDSQKEETATRESMGIDPREYEEMYARIRAELIEELKQEHDREQTKS